MSRLKYLRDRNRLVRVPVSACIRIRVYTCALPTSLATFNILPYGFAVQLYRGTREQDFAHPASVFIVARTCFRNRGYERGWLLQMGVIAKLRDGGNCQGSLLETWMLVDRGEGIRRKRLSRILCKIIRHGGEGGERRKLASCFAIIIARLLILSPVRIFITSAEGLPRRFPSFEDG